MVAVLNPLRFRIAEPYKAPDPNPTPPGLGLGLGSTRILPLQANPTPPGSTRRTGFKHQLQAKAGPLEWSEDKFKCEMSILLGLDPENIINVARSASVASKIREKLDQLDRTLSRVAP